MRGPLRDRHDVEAEIARLTAQRRRPRLRHWLRRVLVVIGTTIGLGLLLAIVGLVVVYNVLAAGLPQVSELEHFQPSLVTKVYDRYGELIADFFIERRILVPLDEIPLHVRQATIAAEDARFYTHGGVDLIGILRAITSNIRAGETKEGASTITQQVARTLFLTRERTMSRKLREAILALRIEQRYSKDQILDIYLNQIFYGHNAYGIEAAAQLYFGKPAKELTLAEGALITGLPPAPNTYSPLKNLPLSLKRREHVLRRMVIEGYLTPGEALVAHQEPVTMERARPALPVNKAPYFVEYVRQYLEEQYGPTALYRGGYTVETTIDLKLQQSAEQALKRGLHVLDKRHGNYLGPSRQLALTQDAATDAAMIYAVTVPPEGDTTVRQGESLPGVVLAVKPYEAVVMVKASRGVLTSGGMAWVQRHAGDDVRRRAPGDFFQPGDVIRVRVVRVDPAGRAHTLALEQEHPGVQGALLTLDVDSGHVLAVAGGYDFARSQFNRATQAYRQPGSAFKPVIYALAIESGMTPTTIVQDTPLTIHLPDGKTWRPDNADGKYSGAITLREALTNSRNVVSVRLMEKLGVQKVCVYARRLGINSHLDCYLSLALGASGVSLLEMTSVYGVFANGGIYTQPIFVTKIVDRNGKIIEERHQEAWRVMRPEVAYMITSLMESVVTDGTARDISNLGRPVAGKTGTTNEYHDAWFIGYTPEMVTGVWVGIDDHTPIGHLETGGRAAAPIWLEYMTAVVKDRPMTDFPIPPGVQFVRAGGENGDPGTAWTENDEPLFEAYIDGTHKDAAAQLAASEQRARIARLRAQAVARRAREASGEFRRLLDRLEREQTIVPAEGPEPQESKDAGAH